MRVIFTGFCLLWSLLGFATESVKLVVDVKAAAFTVSLPANPTTGYQWVVEKYDTSHFDKISSQYVAESTTRMGAGGQMQFVFERKKDVDYPACTQMTFRYARPWEPTKGSVTRVTVMFKDATQKKH